MGMAVWSSARFAPRESKYGVRPGGICPAGWLHSMERALVAEEGCAASEPEGGAAASSYDDGN